MPALRLDLDPGAGGVERAGVFERAGGLALHAARALPGVDRKSLVHGRRSEVRLGGRNLLNTGDFRQRPEPDCSTGISRPSRPPEHPIVAIHGTFPGLAEIADWIRVLLQEGEQGVSSRLPRP